MKDAPDSIRAIAIELKLLSGILEKVGNEEQQRGVGSGISNILDSCREQVASLVKIVDRFVPSFEADSRRTRTWGSFKALFKDKIDA